jgi:hypothetical protein
VLSALAFPCGPRFARVIEEKFGVLVVVPAIQTLGHGLSSFTGAASVVTVGVPRFPGTISTGYVFPMFPVFPLFLKREREAREIVMA